MLHKPEIQSGSLLRIMGSFDEGSFMFLSWIEAVYIVPVVVHDYPTFKYLKFWHPSPVLPNIWG